MCDLGCGSHTRFPSSFHVLRRGCSRKVKKPSGPFGSDGKRPEQTNTGAAEKRQMCDLGCDSQSRFASLFPRSSSWAAVAKLFPNMLSTACF